MSQWGGNGYRWIDIEEKRNYLFFCAKKCHANFWFQLLVFQYLDFGYWWDFGKTLIIASERNGLNNSICGFLFSPFHSSWVIWTKKFLCSFKKRDFIDVSLTNAFPSDWEVTQWSRKLGGKKGNPLCFPFSLFCTAHLSAWQFTANLNALNNSINQHKLDEARVPVPESLEKQKLVTPRTPFCSCTWVFIYEMNENELNSWSLDPLYIWMVISALWDILRCLVSGRELLNWLSAHVFWGCWAVLLFILV